MGLSSRTCRRWAGKATFTSLEALALSAEISQVLLYAGIS